ncbi:DNase I-like protein [Sodiomyces alkalinus F11]|uniref:DNase I-like protein n=1 Tax=Sodiomyces alkalinus (strain CBS 110278 / VKM F-3762 / F11) TaxID=1314773 RepID=A0A3N2QA94_SODAK|nr:DNase I-like protein [Sodiomyces alkalinus F11]ROT43670.1 DNase I-like protein [Sodiomyces alkalinus F11]
MAVTDPSQPDSSTPSDPIDLTSTPVSLARAVHARRSEYVRPHRVRVKVGSWNVAACPGTDKDLASWFVDGKGVDKSLATLDISHTRAVEDESYGSKRAGSSEDDGSEVRLVGGDQIGLYVLGLQEIIDLNRAREAVNRMYYDPGPMNKWKEALERAMPPGYRLITAEQMSGLLLLIYASTEVAATVSNVSTVQVGTGLLGYLGNKGAVTTRILLGETTRMVFTNSHLASGAEQVYLERRLWDYGQVLARTQFEPIRLPGMSEAECPSEKIGDEDFAFWLGDLNFRLDGLPGDDIRRLLMLHSRGEYDLTKKQPYLEGEEGFVVQSADSDDDDESTVESSTSRSTVVDESDSSLPDPDDFLPDPRDDPGSLQATLDSLLPHDQLRRVIKQRKAFHDGWREGPVTFLPSYKYDIGTVSLFDSSEKQRAPSWCDRILYRTRRDREEYERKIKEEEAAKEKDAEMKARGMEDAADDDDVLFSCDPEEDAETEEQRPKKTSSFDEYDDYNEDEDADNRVREGERGGEEGEEQVTKEGFTDQIQLDIYTSHQRITSSDHKPIVSIFTVDYNAVVPELKAAIHAEVAKELDRAENEGRPLVTVVVDSQDGTGKEPPGRLADQGEPIDFGEISFMGKHTTYLTIANTGQVPAKFAFVETPSIVDHDSSSAPQWLNASFRRRESDADETQEDAVDLGDEVKLEPGETLSAVLEVMVDDLWHVRALNDGRAKLEDILVLRVRDGRDHFIPVQATWLPTCFGRSIEELIRVPSGGIRAFAKERERAGGPGGGGAISYDLEVHSAAPRELFKLTEMLEALTTRALADASMLDQEVVPADKPGWPLDESAWVFRDEEERRAQKLSLIEALDTDKPLADALPLDTPSPHRLEVVSEVLLLFLRGLTDGIITAPLWAKIEVALPQLSSAPAPASSSSSSSSSYPLRRTQEAEAGAEDDKEAILDILSSAPNHNIAFVFLAAALFKVVEELAPLSRADVGALTSPVSPVKRISALGRHSLGFRRNGGGSGGGGNNGSNSGGGNSLAVAEAALGRRRARERRFAEIVGRVVCRVGLPAKEKERRAVEEKMRCVVEMFLRKPLDSS